MKWIHVVSIPLLPFALVLFPFGFVAYLLIMGCIAGWNTAESLVERIAKE